MIKWVAIELICYIEFCFEIDIWLHMQTIRVAVNRFACQMIDIVQCEIENKCEQFR